MVEKWYECKIIAKEVERRPIGNTGCVELHIELYVKCLNTEVRLPGVKTIKSVICSEACR